MEKPAPIPGVPPGNFQLNFVFIYIILYFSMIKFNKGLEYLSQIKSLMVYEQANFIESKINIKSYYSRLNFIYLISYI